MTELSNIETLDPGFPGINLEISDALLRAKHASEAKNAVNLQISVSDCLANLSPADQHSYCKSQWTSEPQAGCLAELARINQQAHYEAGLVDAGIRNAGNAGGSPLSQAALAPPRPRPVAVVPASTAAPSAAGVTAEAPAAAAALPPKPLPPINIKSIEAPQHVGELARVCGNIVSKHTAADSNGKPTFINLDRTFPDQTFTVVVWGKDAPTVGDLPESGNLCVTGTVAMYRGTPQIVVSDASSWSASSR